MSGTLYVVATPIGNLEDITLRALRVLRDVDVIAAEDTRRTAKLLAHHSIATRTLSFHAHNTRMRLPQLISRLKADEDVALVTDAGTPGVSDPGTELVQACRLEGISVVPIPGASAPLTAAVASGFPLEPLLIKGFAPSRSKDRTAFFTAVAEHAGTVIFFEAPHRVLQSLKDLGILLGERQIAVARELTKIHEEVLVGTATEIVGRLPNPKGEFTVVVGPRAESAPPPERPSDNQIAREFGEITENGLIGRRAAVNRLAKRFGMRANEVYSIVEKQKTYVE